MTVDAPIRIGISACLLGDEVRYDGGHKRDPFLTDVLGPLLARFPHLPVEDEGRLSDPRLRENFIERVFAYRRLRDLFESRWTIGDLVHFHTAHTLVLRAHSAQAHARLDQLVAGATSMDREAVRSRYAAGLMEALAIIP